MAAEKSRSVPGAMMMAAESIPLAKISSSKREAAVLVSPEGLTRVCRGRCCWSGPAAVMTAFLIFMEYLEILRTLSLNDKAQGRGILEVEIRDSRAKVVFSVSQ